MIRPLPTCLLVVLGAPALAQDRPILDVYTYDSFVTDYGPGPAVEAAFEADCGCDLRWTSAGDGAALLARLELEGATTEADVVLGLDANLIARARGTGLFAPHGQSPALDLPVAWEDDTFLPFDWGWFAFVGNEGGPMPTSFRELAESDATVVIEDPRSSTPGLGLVQWVEAAYGEEAPAIWEALADNVVTVTPGWSEAYGLFLEGEADLVLSYTTSPAYHLLAEDDASKVALPFDEGHMLQVEVAATVAGTDQPDLAAAFLAFMLTDGFQAVIPETNWMYPAVTPDGGLPDGFESLRPESTLYVDPDEAEAGRAAAIEAWRTALSVKAAGPGGHPGTIAAILVAVLCLGPLGPLLARGSLSFGTADLAALRFTVLQAALSAGLSGLLAIPVARALARRAFPGRGAVVTLMGAPFILPTIVAVLGILAVWGRSGWISDGLAWAGLPRISPYGLGGVVLAHVVLNLPLATRLLLQGWLAIPAERFRLAASLGAPVGPLLERPMLREVLPGVLAAIFALCLTSFSVALILGGGPRATTVELGIYQAVRFEADLGGAATLALMQYALSGTAALVAVRLASGPVLGGGLGRRVERWDSRGAGSRLLDALAIAGAALLLGLPLAAVALRGLPGLLDLPPGTGAAALRSLLVALAATALCMGLALALALRGGALAQGAGALPLAASPLVLGTGLLILLRPLVALDRAALPVTALVDGLLALPFALRALVPAVAEARARTGLLAEALGLRGLAWLRIAILPAIRPAMGFAAGLAAALSVGNLGAVALFGGTTETLPLLMARLTGAYRMEAAAGAGLVTVAMALALYAAFDRWGRNAPA